MKGNLNTDLTSKGKLPSLAFCSRVVFISIFAPLFNFLRVNPLFSGNKAPKPLGEAGCSVLLVPPLPHPGIFSN